MILQCIPFKVLAYGIPYQIWKYSILHFSYENILYSYLKYE